MCPEWALKVVTLCTSTPRASIVAVSLSTIQEAEVTSVVVPAEGATHCLPREIKSYRAKMIKE